MQSNVRSVRQAVALLMFGAAIALPFSACRTFERNSEEAPAVADETAAQSDASPDGCVTLVDDPAAPATRIFSNPEEESSEVLEEVENGTEVTVIEYENGWLQISTPVAGWVFLGSTKVFCGDVNTGETLVDNINSLKERAIGGDRLAADTLVRYTFQADGAGADLALGAVLEWAETNPEFLITVLDEQPQSVRSGVLSLLKFVLSPEAQSAFELALSEQPDSLTAQIWEGGDRPQP